MPSKKNKKDPTLKQNFVKRHTPEALGFKVGKKTYIDNIAKDMVLSMQYKGQKLEPGTKLPKTASIDLVLGNGNRPTSN